MRCACGHEHEGVCLAKLPADPETETPAWRCPCRCYAPAGGWRWHAPTKSWALPSEPAA